jgi:hypothetical protein
MRSADIATQISLEAGPGVIPLTAKPRSPEVCLGPGGLKLWKGQGDDDPGLGDGALHAPFQGACKSFDDA